MFEMLGVMNVEMMQKYLGLKVYPSPFTLPSPYHRSLAPTQTRVLPFLKDN